MTSFLQKLPEKLSGLLQMQKDQGRGLRSLQLFQESVSIQMSTEYGKLAVLLLPG